MTDDREFMPQVSDDLPAGERPMLAIVHAIPGHEAPLADAVAVLAAAVRREPGCTEFRVFHDATDRGVFYMYEIYRNTDAFKAHLRTDHVAHFFTQLAQHSTTDAKALTQLIELPVSLVLHPVLLDEPAQQRATAGSIPAERGSFRRRPAVARARPRSVSQPEELSRPRLRGQATESGG